MIAYEVIKPFNIDYSIDNNIHLETGDFLFLESGYFVRVILKGVFNDMISSKYSEAYVLKKILYKGGDIKKDEYGEIYFDECWKEFENINLFNPLINNKITIEEALLGGFIIKSVVWIRAAKLKELGI